MTPPDADSPDDDLDALRDRVTRLELSLKALQTDVRALRAQRTGASRQDAPRTSPPPAVRPTAPPPTSPAPAPPSPPRRTPLAGWSMEGALNKLGIALLLFGLVFLFRYAIDVGWLTPPVRVAFGGVLGLALGAAGLVIRRRRAAYGQVLLGGGLAALYATGFAAYQLYALVAYPTAFALMVGVTAAAFVLSVRQGDAALAVIGVLGGLGTPFLLYRDTGSLPGLVVYTCVLLAFSGAVFWRTGWRTLLYATVTGGWLVLLTGLFTSVWMENPAWIEQASLQAGAVFAGLVFGVLPSARDVLRPGEGGPDASASPFQRWVVRHPAYVLAVTTPVTVLYLTMATWSLDGTAWGAVGTAMAAAYALAAAGLRRAGHPRLGLAHALAAATLAALSLTAFFDGPVLLAALAAEAAALHVLARRLEAPPLALAAHLLFAAVGVWVAGRIAEEATPLRPFVDAEALPELLVIVLAAWTALGLRSRAQLAYAVAAHGLFLGWTLRELAPLPGGQAYASALWGAYAVVLLVAGLRLDHYAVRAAALGTLVLLVGKLFLVDLARLEAVWRVLLFLGLGAGFVLISYFLPALWRPPAPPDAAPSDEA